MSTPPSVPPVGDGDWPDADDAPGFAELGLSRELVDALTALGFEEPTPIQREAIPPLLAGRDLLGQAATGTGKTAAFAAPILAHLPAPEDRSTGPSALVLAPTRELVVQVAEATHRYGRGVAARVLPVYGGAPIGRQIQALHRGVDVVVATPGRALDHLARGTLQLDDVATVVLDEADEMLDMGFVEDIEAILAQAPSPRQTVLFSATIPPRIDALAARYLTDPVRILIDGAAARGVRAGAPAPTVRQIAYLVPAAYKAEALGRIFDVEAPGAALVFCRTRDEVDELTETLNARGYRAEALHGGMGQEQRDRVMGRLRAGTADLVVATDVAARGLDIEQLTHVVNFDVPSAPDAYVHRVGRVGRAGREGVAITLAEPREHRLLRTIERVTGARIPVAKLPTLADLRARRLELMQAALAEAVVAEDLDRYRVVVESLTDEFDLMDVALAAVKVAHEATRGVEQAAEVEIPEVTLRGPRERGPQERAGQPPTRRPARPRGEEPRRGGATARLWVGAGRAAGVRPQDLVGAITGETRLAGRDVGAIEIAERFSLVEVPEAAVDEVIDGLRGTTLKGKRVTVRRDRGAARPGVGGRPAGHRGAPGRRAD
jgi:ATP-dependent RNA helicase DeaD